MKLKQHQQQTASSSSSSSVINNAISSHATVNLALVGSNDATAATATGPNGHQAALGDDPSGSSTIWTRSAASRAAQQQQQLQQQQQQQPAFESMGSLLPPPPNFSSTGHGSGSSGNGGHRRHHHHHHSHNHHQHTLGKIVKPIPVRPMSSSSSTHSSSFSNALAAGHLSSHLGAKAAALASQDELALPSTASSAGLAHSKSAAEPGENFSLIAKYFASFPATRLKSTIANDLVQHNSSSSLSNSQSQSPILNAAPGGAGATVVAVEQAPFTSSFRPMANALSHNSTTMTSAQHGGGGNVKSTPFMPFKKPGNAYVRPTIAANEQTEAPAPATTTLLLRSHTQNTASTATNQTTDHLCTNFKRMIKLNDQIEEATAAAAASPATRASNTPTGAVVSTSNGDLNADAGGSSSSGLLSASQAQLTNGDYHHYPCPYSADAGNSPMEPSRFGQIQMETRSTRKFLIKHHPYLQFTSSLGSGYGPASSNKCANSGPRSLQNPMRPSMDLIKMKKLISVSNRRTNSGATNTDDDDQLDNNHESSPLLFNRSGRSSRSNNSQGHQIQQQATNEHEQDARLMKFIDSIPSSTSANRTVTPTMGPPKTIPGAAAASGCPNSASSLNKSLRIANKRRSTKDSLDSSTSTSADANCKLVQSNKTRNSVKAQVFVNSSCSSGVQDPSAAASKNNYQSAKSNTNCLENENCNCGAGLAHDKTHDLFTSDDYLGSIMNDDDCQEEDSSGYYSSYQSVDLISSSGASSGGDRQLTNKASLNLEHLIHKTDNAASDSSASGVGVGEAFKQPVPHHHYHTRYLTNYLQQSVNGKQSKPSGNKLISSPSSPAAVVSSPSYAVASAAQTTPTTRLRYQQQLAAAAAAAANKHHVDIHHQHQQLGGSHRIECCDGDIDLDQIEND